MARTHCGQPLPESTPSRSTPREEAVARGQRTARARSEEIKDLSPVAVSQNWSLLLEAAPSAIVGEAYRFKRGMSSNLPRCSVQ